MKVVFERMYHMEHLVSVVIPVYNAEKYLREALDSIINQTYINLEIVCVDDGSTDSSPEILEEYKAKDNRIVVYRKENSGGGAARNYGIERTTGDYLYFFDSDDIAKNSLIEKALSKAVETNADIVAFDAYTFKDDNIELKTLKKGFNRSILEDFDKETFSYKDFPNKILSIINIVPWNKLIRREIVMKNNVRFDEISSSDDLTFSVMCAAVANKIAVMNEVLLYYRLGHAGTITSTMRNKLFNVKLALESVERQIKALPYAEEIKLSLYYLIIENYCFIFSNYTYDFETQQSKDYYNFIRERFLDDELGSLTCEDIGNMRIYVMYESIKKHSYEEMLALRSRDITVSLTSYPGRISYVHSVIENIAAQTLKPKRVLLWLAKHQFPNGNEDLPQNLLDCVSRGEVEIRWCDDDLRSHKKYFYTMQEYPEDIVITVDDDLVYPPDMIFNLYQSYLAFPDCVSGMRVHVIGVDRKNEKIIDYSKWMKQYDRDILIPSTQFFATTGAGCLFPPGTVDSHAFNKEKIFELCPFADDIWMNFMVLAKGVKTVCAVRNFGLRYSAPQENSLFIYNSSNNKNEEQFNAVRDWLEKDFGENYFFDQVSNHCGEFDLNDPLVLIDYTEYQRKEKMLVDKKLIKTFAEKSEINAKLKKTYAEKAERGVEIKKLSKENKKLLSDVKLLKKRISDIESSKAYRIYKFIKHLFKRK